MVNIKSISLAGLFWDGWFLSLLFTIFYYNFGIIHVYRKTTLLSAIIFLVGGVIVIYSHYCIRRRRGVLATDGIYRFTRHPIYHGFLVLDLSYWVPLPQLSDKIFYIAQVFFVVGLVACAYFEEKEVLAKYGSDAVEYYRVTPRVIILYPLRIRKLREILKLEPFP